MLMNRMIDTALTGQYAVRTDKASVLRILNVISRSPDGAFLIAAEQERLHLTYYAVYRITDEQTAVTDGSAVHPVTLCERLAAKRSPEDFEDFITFRQTEWRMQHGYAVMQWLHQDTWKQIGVRLVFDRELAETDRGRG